MAYQEQPVILFLVFSSIDAEIYFQVNVYIGLERNIEVVGQDRKNVVGKIKRCHPISFQEAKKKKSRCRAEPRCHHQSAQVIVGDTSLLLCW